MFPKFNQILGRAPVADVGPLFYQLLKLVAESPSASAHLVASVAAYFNAKLTLAERRQAEDGGGAAASSVDMDSIDLIQTADHSCEEVQQAEGMVIYYISQAAKMGHPIAKEIIKQTRGSVNFPAAILNPFTLFNCLALTAVGQWSGPLLDSLKATIAKGYSLEESREACVWFRSVTPGLPDIAGMEMDRLLFIL